MKHITDPFIILVSPLPSGDYMYTVVDQRLFYTDERQAIAKRDSLNAEWKENQQFQERVGSLLAAYRKEKK